MIKYICFLFLVSLTTIKCEENSQQTIEIDPDDFEENTEFAMEDGFETEKGVFNLNQENFDKFLETRETILVEFYAPWCGHCKKLMPEFEKAAEELKENKNIALAKVDATMEKKLAEKYEVKGYPTLIAFKNGQQTEFDDSRDKDGIVSFLNKLSSPTWAPPKEETIVLTKENFTEVVNQHDVVVVMFYAPWCGHCKRLKPEYEKAAKELVADNENIPLAKVDATIEKELAAQYNVEGYPTMKVFRRGRVYEFKSDARDSWGLVTYIKGLTAPASKPLKGLKEVKKLISSSEGFVFPVAFFESEDHPLSTIFFDVANGIRDDYPFRHTFDSKVASSLKVPANCLVFFATDRFHTKHEDAHKLLQFTDKTTAGDIEGFINKNTLPLVGELNEETKEKFYKEARPLVLLFYTVDWSFEHRDATQMWRRRFATIAAKHPSLKFAIADEEKNSDLFKQFGFDESSEELNVGILSVGDQKYPMEEMEEYDSDQIEDFIAQFNKGKLKPRIKSQAKPAKQAGPVVTVVGKTFEEIVLDPTKDVLIEMYAPWCGHCKQLEPLYKKLATKLKDEKHLVIAKIDATANDSPPSFSAEGFPTIYFAPANNKDSPIKFTGGRTVDEMEKFLRQNAVVAFKGDKEEL